MQTTKTTEHLSAIHTYNSLTTTKTVD